MREITKREDKRYMVIKEIKILFGMRIKKLRKKQALSQEHLAEKAEISSKYLSRIEMGQHFPSFDTLIKLAKALHIELKDFFEFTHRTSNLQDLKKNLNALLNEVADEDILRLLEKLVRALLK